MTEISITPSPSPITDELTLAARDLTLQAIGMARYYLENGSPQMKLSIIRALVTPVARAAAGGAGEQEELAGMRGELQALNQRLLSA